MDRHVLLLAATLTLGAGAPRFVADAPHDCTDCSEWNAPQEPFRVYGNTYYVGVAGLSSILVTSDAGLVLLDGGLPQSAAAIDSHIRSLGFHTEEIRLIVNSHAHYDHAGGIAALQRASGATVAASAAGARALEQGSPTADDPQFAFGPEVNHFPPVREVRRVEDGGSLRVGSVTITAHLTPGHTAGSTTWTWRSCEADRCLDVVYADSLTAVSAPPYRFSGGPGGPGPESILRRSIATVAALPCDILLTVHPGFADLHRKLDARRSGGTSGRNPFVDPEACRAYAADATMRLDRRLADETGP
jgi:metallo-beta-lactamase class B